MKFAPPAPNLRDFKNTLEEFPGVGNALNTPTN
jgi:hypothetical protein